MESPQGKDRSEGLKADLVAIGGGGAGLAAAVTAAEQGASAIVLEKRNLGGSSAMAFGIFAAESPVQRRIMVDCRVEDCFKVAMDFAHWRINPRIVNAFLKKSGDTVRWLEEKGVEFDCIPFYPNQVPTWHVVRGRGAALIKALEWDCQEMGVPLLTNTPAKKILADGKGNITGVLAETQEGEEIVITARSVVIASGGYSGNKELLDKYCQNYPECVRRGGPMGSTGDGLLMAIELGAATEGLGMIMMSGPIPQMGGPMFLRVGTPPEIDVNGMFIGLEPRTVWVNKRGRRIADETLGYYHYESCNTTARQPEAISYTIFDTNVMQDMIEHGLILGLGVAVGAQGNKLTGLDKELQARVDKGGIMVADCWDEIAEWIGCDPGVLKVTVDEYNTACERGFDSLFFKDRKYLIPLSTQPYYAIKCSVNGATVGGIKINERMEVVDQQENPIPGLYAAGVDTGGWETETYCERLAGSAFGFAVNSGRIAAENAVKFLSAGS
jgi:fumarate reductase flavoprotein subunit